MNVKEESIDHFKTLHLEVLKTHARLVKKYWKMGVAGEKIAGNTYKDTLSQEDIAGHAIALKEAHEAYEARKNWLAAQLKYFQFIERNRFVS